MIFNLNEIVYIFLFKQKRLIAAKRINVLFMIALNTYKFDSKYILPDTIFKLLHDYIYKQLSCYSKTTVFLLQFLLSST